MTRKYLWLGILTIVLSVIVVRDLNAQTDNRLNGIWVGTDGAETRLINGNYERSGIDRGTYTTNSGIIVLTPTHIYGDFLFLMHHGINNRRNMFESRWYSLSESDNEVEGIIGKIGASVFKPISIGYTVNSNILTFTFTYEEGNETVSFIRKN